MLLELSDFDGIKDNALVTFAGRVSEGNPTNRAELELEAARLESQLEQRRLPVNCPG